MSTSTQERWEEKNVKLNAEKEKKLIASDISCQGVPVVASSHSIQDWQVWAPAGFCFVRLLSSVIARTKAGAAEKAEHSKIHTLSCT